MSKGLNSQFADQQTVNLSLILFPSNMQQIIPQMVPVVQQARPSYDQKEKVVNRSRFY